MSCITYVHNNPLISQMQISGTSCGGSVVNYIVSYGQSVCMDSSKPVLNLNGLQISGSCTSVTPTPSPFPPYYCFNSGLTYYTATYQCPNNGQNYLDQYGVIKVTILKDFVPSGDHPDYTFTVTNGTEIDSFQILRGESFNEFIYPKVDFRYTDTGCTTTTLPDWTISNTGGVAICGSVTPPPTPTPTITPTVTSTPTPTITSTPTHKLQRKLVKNKVYIWLVIEEIRLTLYIPQILLIGTQVQMWVLVFLVPSHPMGMEQDGLEQVRIQREQQGCIIPIMELVGVLHLYHQQHRSLEVLFGMVLNSWFHP